MTRLSLHYQKPRQMRNQNLIEAAFRKAIVATIYLQDKPEFMLSAKVNKNSTMWYGQKLPAAWLHLEYMNGQKSTMKAALDESCPRQGQYTQSIPEIQIRNHAQ